MTDKISISTKMCDSNDEIVVIESNHNDLPVSFQVLQDIYHAITGKSEEIANGYKISYKLTFEDLEQLYIKINQAFEQYNIKSHNCSVTVFFTKDSKEVFSSFERFKLFNRSTLSEVERLYIKINFMIVVPKTKRVQNYEINVNLASRIALSKKLNSDMIAPSKIVRLIVDDTASVSIKYIDYLVARNFIDIIDEWMKSLPENKPPEFYKFISKRSNIFPVIIKNGFFIMFLLMVYWKIDTLIPASSNSLNLLAQFAFFSMAIGYLSLRVAWSLGTIVENAIDGYSPISYICLTRGDEKLIKEATKDNLKKILKATIGIILTLATGIIASVIANKIS